MLCSKLHVFFKGKVLQYWNRCCSQELMSEALIKILSILLQKNIYISNIHKYIHKQIHKAGSFVFHFVKQLLTVMNIIQILSVFCKGNVSTISILCFMMENIIFSLFLFIFLRQGFSIVLVVLILNMQARLASNSESCLPLCLKCWLVSMVYTTMPGLGKYSFLKI